MKSKKYEEFVEKFKPKKTTDDCYTPPAVYEAVKGWAVKEYGLEEKEIVRPFYLGGDYENFNYSDNTVVIDNPPFSILSKIMDFYTAKGIKFFLFAPHLTLFSSNRNKFLCYLICGTSIIYENGAKVSTSFITNLDNYIIRCVPDLMELITEAQKKSRNLPKYSYPKNIVTSTRLELATKAGMSFKLKRGECYFVRRLDTQKEMKKTIFGAGFLIPDYKADELKEIMKEAEKEITFGLSEREKEIIKNLGYAEIYKKISRAIAKSQEKKEVKNNGEIIE